jgi:hypothetical protein
MNTRAHTTLMSTSERLSRLDLEIHEVCQHGTRNCIVANECVSMAPEIIPKICFRPMCLYFWYFLRENKIMLHVVLHVIDSQC